MRLSDILVLSAILELSMILNGLLSPGPRVEPEIP